MGNLRTVPQMRVPHPEPAFGESEERVRRAMVPAKSQHRSALPGPRFRSVPPPIEKHDGGGSLTR